MSKTIIQAIPKIHPKHIQWLMPLILSGMMSGCISCFNVLMNVGFINGFLHKWLASWSLSWLIAYPLIMVFLPLVRNFLIEISLDPKQENSKPK